MRIELHTTLAVLFIFVSSLSSMMAQEIEPSGESPAAQSQTDQEPALEPFAVLAWNRTDKYMPPDFEGFFPTSDEAAAKRLEDFLGDAKLCAAQPDEYIEAVRRGLLSTERYKTTVLSGLGNTFIWGKEPQNEKAIELMYHASGTDNHDIQHYAMYFGSTVVANRSDNLMRMMMLNHHRFDRGIQRRLHWSFRTIGDQAKTAEQLEQLLDQHETLGEFPTIATYEYYKQLTGHDPPAANRFKQLGQWVVGFAHKNVSAFKPGGSQELREMLGQHLDFGDDKVVSYVGRIDGEKWVGVVLADGIGNMERLVEDLETADDFSLEFSERLNERLFQSRRLGEFAKFWSGELANAKPKYTLPKVDAVYDWNRENKYIEPNYAEFFPDDVEAGERLDQLVKDPANPPLTDREILEAFRAGLKRAKTSPNSLMSFLTNALGWPSDPYQTEILYHAAALDAPKQVRYYSVYYGLGTWWNKSDNVLQLFADIIAQSKQLGGHDLTGRILWSIRDDSRQKETLADFIAKKLNGHAEMDDATLTNLVQNYKQLVGVDPPGFDAVKDRGVFLIRWRRSRSKTQLELAAYFQSIENRNKDNGPIGFHIMPQNDRDYCVAVVGGIRTYEWLLKLLEADDGNSIDVALPWPKSWNLKKDGLPTREHLEALLEKR